MDLEVQITITAWLESALDSPFGIKLRLDPINENHTSISPAYYYHAYITRVRKQFAPAYDSVALHYGPDPDHELWLINDPGVQPIVDAYRAGHRPIPNPEVEVAEDN